MNNTVALILFGLVVLTISLDVFMNAGDGTIFVARKFLDMMAWLAFWR